MGPNLPSSPPVIVSNRLPVNLTRHGTGWSAKRASGGLVTALEPVLKAYPDGLWIGWPGCDRDPKSEAAIEKVSASGSFALAPVWMSPTDRDLFYLGFCNEILWPLFHDLQFLCNFDPDYFRCYERVNRDFAQTVAGKAPKNGQVWIHDYHLMQVADALRHSRPDLQCGFFLHIPFPSPDVFAKLPWREHILQGLLAHRLAGFQTPRDLKNFIGCCKHFLGAQFSEEGRFTRVTWAGQSCLVGAFPIGIDTADFATRAAAPEVARKARELRDSMHGRQIILGLDRLDYTKGIPHRLRSFQTLLRNYPELCGKVTFVQVVVPSREEITSYSRLKSEIEQLVSQINGEFTDVGQWVPIHYVYRHLDQTDLLAWYRAAQIALVTPLKDGMNLVAKEFCACSLDEDCVLVLSEFAGAADELKEWAMLVNPNDREGIADALARACNMPTQERKRAMAGMRKHLRHNTVFRFASDFLAALSKRPPEETESSGDLLTRKVLDLSDSPHRTVLLLDYDGTLAPICDKPEQAAPTAELRRLLGQLAERFTVHIVSGRPRATLEAWLGDLPIGLHGEHGLWSRLPGKAWKPNANPPTGWMDALEATMERIGAPLPGSFVERKERAIAWHYRLADQARAEEAKSAILAAAKQLPATPAIEALFGHKVVEFRVKGIHKGLVVPQVVRPGHPVLAAGDDRTDEDLFKSLPGHALLVRVGQGESIAPHRLADPAALHALLNQALSVFAE